MTQRVRRIRKQASWLCGIHVGVNAGSTQMTASARPRAQGHEHSQVTTDSCDNQCLSSVEADYEVVIGLQRITTQPFVVGVLAILWSNAPSACSEYSW